MFSCLPLVLIMNLGSARTLELRHSRALMILTKLVLFEFWKIRLETRDATQFEIYQIEIHRLINVVHFLHYDLLGVVKEPDLLLIIAGCFLVSCNNVSVEENEAIEEYADDFSNCCLYLKGKIHCIFFI